MGKKLDREKLYPWLTILRVKGMGSGRALYLERHFGTIRKALRASPDEIAPLSGFSKDVALGVKEAAGGKFDREVDRELAWAEKEGVSILLHADVEYPVQLRHIDAPPAILYVKGNLLAQDILSIAMVGSRQASDAGKRLAGKIACTLAEAGLTIVSGLAWGIDASAHKGALRCREGRTLAVLGNGLKMVYPREHGLLADEIVKKGALITELFYDVTPQGRNFPPRNRIISGLSLGVVIVEAPSRSGSLITANYALEHGREVFALPGVVEISSSPGTNKLIQDSAAKLVTSAEDILTELESKIAFYRSELEGKIPRVDLAPEIKLSTETEGNDSPKQAIEEESQEKISEAKPVENQAGPPLSEDETVVYRSLSPEPKHIDSICRELEWPVARVSSALGLLEFKELAERESGMRFRLKDRDD